MIPAQELIKIHGKQKFVEMATNSQPKETGHYQKKQSSIRRMTTWDAYCQHKVHTIKEGKPFEECSTCNGSRGETKLKDFKPYFNAGLGGWVESRADEKQSARAMGLTEAG